MPVLPRVIETPKIAVDGGAAAKSTGGSGDPFWGRASLWLVGTGFMVGIITAASGTPLPAESLEKASVKARNRATE
jgi:hypothetical protein